MSAAVLFSPPPLSCPGILASSSSFLFTRSYPGEGSMADSPASHLADEAPAPGSSEAVHGTSRDMNQQEDIEGESTSEPMREELVQSAVSFLKHPKVVASSDVQRRSFPENKGLTVQPNRRSVSTLTSSSKVVHGDSPDTKEQEDTQGEVAAATSE